MVDARRTITSKHLLYSDSTCSICWGFTKRLITATVTSTGSLARAGGPLYCWGNSVCLSVCHRVIHAQNCRISTYALCSSTEWCISFWCQIMYSWALAFTLNQCVKQMCPTSKAFNAVFNSYARWRHDRRRALYRPIGFVQISLFCRLQLAYNAMCGVFGISYTQWVHCNRFLFPCTVTVLATSCTTKPQHKWSLSFYWSHHINMRCRVWSRD